MLCRVLLVQVIEHMLLLSIISGLRKSSTKRLVCPDHQQIPNKVSALRNSEQKRTWVPQPFNRLRKNNSGVLLPDVSGKTGCCWSIYLWCWEKQKQISHSSHITSHYIHTVCFNLHISFISWGLAGSKSGSCLRRRALFGHTKNVLVCFFFGATNLLTTLAVKWRYLSI